MPQTFSGTSKATSTSNDSPLASGLRLWTTVAETQCGRCPGPGRGSSRVTLVPFRINCFDRNLHPWQLIWSVVVSSVKGCRIAL
jgi:hypothetical protein